MRSISEIEEEIIREFQGLDSIDEKYATLFRIGDNLPEMDPALKTEPNRVKGCQSTVWFHLDADDGRCHLVADSDSMVIKGITALLVRLIEGRRPNEISTISMDFLNRIDIWKLPSQRNSGLMAMIDHIKKEAGKMASEIKQENTQEGLTWQN